MTFSDSIRINLDAFLYFVNCMLLIYCFIIRFLIFVLHFQADIVGPQSALFGFLLLIWPTFWSYVFSPLYNIYRPFVICVGKVHISIFAGLDPLLHTLPVALHGPFWLNSFVENSFGWLQSWEDLCLPLSVTCGYNI